jgi:hypothetical protein
MQVQIDDSAIKAAAGGLGVFVTLLAGLAWVFRQGQNFQRIERALESVEKMGARLEALEDDAIGRPELMAELDKLRHELTMVARAQCEKHAVKCELERVKNKK